MGLKMMQYKRLPQYPFLHGTYLGYYPRLNDDELRSLVESVSNEVFSPIIETSSFGAGLIFAPYIPIQLDTLVWSDSDNTFPNRSISSRYAHRVVNSDYFGSIIIGAPPKTNIYLKGANGHDTLFLPLKEYVFFDVPTFDKVCFPRVNRVFS